VIDKVDMTSTNSNKPVLPPKETCEQFSVVLGALLEEIKDLGVQPLLLPFPGASPLALVFGGEIRRLPWLPM
jgi:hypothetical protein